MSDRESPTSTVPPEYTVLQKNYDEVVSTVKHGYRSIGGNLFAKGILSPDQNGDIGEMRSAQAAKLIVDTVVDRVEINGKAFYTFIKALSKEGEYAKELVSKLVREACLEKLKEDCPKLNILVIGATGSGKSTLVNNLLGQNVAVVGHGLRSETESVTEYNGKVRGVPVGVFDTPGLADNRQEYTDQTHLEEIEEILPDIEVIIFCFDMSPRRFQPAMVEPLEKYNEIEIDWGKTVVAFTFADNVVIPKDKKDDAERIQFFNSKVKAWKKEIENVLGEDTIAAILPTAEDKNETLGNGKPWFGDFWLAIVKALPAAPMVRFLAMSAEEEDEDDIPPPPAHKKQKLVREKIRHTKPSTSKASTGNDVPIPRERFRPNLTLDQQEELEETIGTKLQSVAKDVFGVAAMGIGAAAILSGGGLLPFIVGGTLFGAGYRLLSRKRKRT